MLLTGFQINGLTDKSVHTYPYNNSNMTIEEDMTDNDRET